MAESEEIWKPIPGFDGYFISNQARVRSNKRRKVVLKPRIYHGYLWVGLMDNEGRNRLRAVHRLVAEAFIPNPDNKPEIDHINTQRDDNRIENLRWVTHSENCRNELSLERYRKRKGVNSPRFGKKASAETKSKLRAAHLGKKLSQEHVEKIRHRMQVDNPFRGKRHSDEAKRKMREKKMGENHPNFGKHRSEETRKKISASQKGKVPSQEALLKAWEATRGGNNKFAKPVAQYSLDCTFIRNWDCVADAARGLAVNSKSIANCAAGKRNKAYNYKWKYL